MEHLLTDDHEDDDKQAPHARRSMALLFTLAVVCLPFAVWWAL